MSNPPGPDHDPEEALEPGQIQPDETSAGDQVTEDQSAAGEEPAEPAQRRFTAPSGFDDGSTQIIEAPPEPATEIISVPPDPAGPAGSFPTEPLMAPRTAAPQAIPPRGDVPKAKVRRGRANTWGWIFALVLVIAALAAVAVLGTVLLTRNSEPAASQEDQVRTTIQNFDVAVQKGDLSTLRTITCGSTKDSYVKYDDRAWADTHSRVAAAKQYPVVASIDQVVVNGDHAEANVTTFMAYAPQTRSTRSFDLQFRDERWKICQAPAG